ncbi:hypothetical protein GGX14DRAFT_452242 [Mycena pura]|uniref:Uncharacterized protein n=1 Tax=Mycena pura TaxID=153505 RepID=A0AAD6VDM5_9AGAR|nr:hypothetical protein GGX14DRAFT_452242 [Mycena pura]
MPKGHRTPAAVRAHSRTSSASRLPVNLQFTQKKALPRAKLPQQRAGFHISSPGEDDDEVEEEWSSESGAITPNPHDDDSGVESDGPPTLLKAVETPPPRHIADLPRVATARPSDFRTPAQAARDTATTPRIADTARLADDARADSRPESRTNTAPPSPLSRRQSRPMSAHSVHRPELRPHPLIRGQSFGQPSLVPPKPSPLLPVAVTFDADVHLSSSPSSVSCLATSPHPTSPGRRSSISSTRSVMTVATQQPPRSVREPRHRTFSTLSTGSSSAALSSLTHLPAVSRPAPHIALFPPEDAHRNDKIHPLLPPPYVANHLTVVSRRAPIREAFERVVRARETAHV